MQLRAGGQQSEYVLYQSQICSPHVSRLFSSPQFTASSSWDLKFVFQLQAIPVNRIVNGIILTVQSKSRLIAGSVAELLGFCFNPHLRHVVAFLDKALCDSNVCLVEI